MKPVIGPLKDKPLAGELSSSLSSRCSMQVATATVLSLVGAALKETLGTVQKHSMRLGLITLRSHCEGIDRKIGVGSGDAQPTGDSG